MEQIVSKHLVKVNDRRPDTEGLEACLAPLRSLSPRATTHGVAITKSGTEGNATCLKNECQDLDGRGRRTTVCAH